jgi:hypothetical protein
MPTYADVSDDPVVKAAVEAQKAQDSSTPPQAAATPPPTIATATGRKTRYGYSGDSTPDKNSSEGRGAWNNQLVAPTDGVRTLSLSPDMEAALKPKMGAMLTGSDGNQYKFSDRTAPNLTGRADIYDPSGKLVKEDGQPITLTNPDPTGKGPPDRSAWNSVANRPTSFGLRVATPDEVTKYNSYIANGNDPNQIPAYDRLAIALAKDPDFLTKPENFDIYHSMVWQPMKASTQDWGTQFSQALADAPASVGGLVSDVWSALTSTLKSVGDSARANVAQISGNDEGVKSATRDLGADTSTFAQGAGQAGADVVNLVNNLANGIAQLPLTFAQLLPLSQDAKDYLDKQAAQIHLANAKEQTNINQLRQSAKDLAVNTYRSLPWAHGLAEEIAKSPGNEAAIRGIATIYNPLNYIAEGAAGLEAVGAFKPTFFEHAMTAAEDTAASVAEATAGKLTRIMPDNLDAVPVAERGAVRDVAQGIRNQTSILDPIAANTRDQFATILTNSTKLAGGEGSANTFVGTVSQNLAKAGDTIKGAVDKIQNFPDFLAEKMAGGNPEAKDYLQHMFEYTMFDGAEKLFGPLGLPIVAGLKLGPKVFEDASAFLKVAGRELTYGEATLPYWQRVAQQTNGVAKGIALSLDNPLVYAATSLGKGFVAGSVTGGVIGGLSNTENPIKGAVGGVAQGGLYGMAGGGFGQVKRFTSPGQYLLEARGDWKRYRDIMSDNERQGFDKMDRGNQLALSQFAQHFPGLQVNYFTDGTREQGYHTFDPVTKRSAIGINLAVKDDAIRQVVGHELQHSATHNGVLSKIYDELLGDPSSNKIGQYTALDASGKPTGIDQTTGRYETNQEFSNLRNTYVQGLNKSGLPTAHLDDRDIAREIYAEHGVDYLTSGKATLDSKSSFMPGWFMPTNAIKTALMKLGYAFDQDGKIVQGTGLFNDLRRNKNLDKLTESYYKSRNRDLSVNPEERADRTWNTQDLKTSNAAQTFLDSAPEIMRKADGTPVREANGNVVLRTKGEVREFNTKQVSAWTSSLEGLSEDQKAEIGHREENGNIFSRYVPDHTIEALTKLNQNNSTQINNLKVLNSTLADKGKAGTEFKLFYHTASIKGRYGSFAGAEKYVTPYGFEVTQGKNINIKGVDFSQLTNNYLKVQNRPGFKGVWNTVSDFIKDSDTYFKNHAEGKPGATDLNDVKRHAINALLGLGTNLNKDLNPLAANAPTSVRSVIKSYRLDRINRLEPTAEVRPFTDENQYHMMNRDYRPAAPKTPDEWEQPVADKIKGWADQKGTVPLQVSRDANGDIKLNTEGKPVYQQQSFGFQQAPPIAKIFADNGPEKGWGKATDYASKKLVKFAEQVKEDPRMSSAIGWYSGMTSKLQKLLGANMDVFGNLLAATSPQTGVVDNFKQSLHALQKASKGDYDTLLNTFQGHVQNAMESVQNDPTLTTPLKKQAAYRKLVNSFEDVPLKDNGTKYNFNSKRVLHVLGGVWDDVANGPKTTNFGDNLTGRSKEATIDVWAGRTLRRLLYEGNTKEWRLNPATEGGVGSGPEYRFAEQSFRKAADKLQMEPHDLQAMLWFAEKQHYADRGWTSGAGKELSDFRNLTAQMDNTDRYQLGLTTFQNEGNFDPAAFEDKRLKLADAIKNTPGVLSSRVHASHGMYFGVEPTFDAEFTVPKGSDISHIHDLVKSISKEHNQEASFVTRVHDDDNAPDRRPIAEFGFKDPISHEKALELAKSFEDNGLGGFTLARNQKGSIVGVRSQSIPEFSGLSHNEWTSNYEKLMGSIDRTNMAYVAKHSADTRVYKRGKDY